MLAVTPEQSKCTRISDGRMEILRGCGGKKESEAPEPQEEPVFYLKMKEFYIVLQWPRARRLGVGSAYR